MSTKAKIRKSDAGMALIMATVFIAVALLTVAALSARYLQQRLDADAYQNYNRTFDALEAAVASSKAKMENTAGNGTIGLDGWTPVYNGDRELVLPAFDASESHPVTLAADGGNSALPPPEFLAFSVNWGNDHRDNNGDGAIDDAREQNMHSLYAAAKYRSVVRRAEAVYRAVNVNVWQNAIFAGSGGVAGVIKGNVSIYGSVHVLGDGLLQGGIALEDAIDLSGTSLIRNNYDKCPAYFRTRVPVLPVVDVNGTLAESLDAKLRVKHGLVSMAGNSEIGQAYSNGSPVKQLMDGTFVTDGWGGKKATPDGGRGIPSDVYSDNGWSKLYDLGDKVKFPLLSDPWRDPVTGETLPKPGAGRVYTHEEYFSEVLVASPSVPTDGIYTGNIVLDVSATDAKGAVYWNATTQTYLQGASAVTATPAATDDYIKFVPTEAMLKMNGQIRINGTLAFAGGGSRDTINYTGRGALFLTGDVNIDTKLLTCNNGVATNYADSYPRVNVLGIMTKTNINLGSGNGASQLDIMGGFYAEKTINSQKQTNVMGTFVSKEFNMTKNVPNIYQVPDLAIYLPLGMIGNYPIVTFAQASWRELGLG